MENNNSSFRPMLETNRSTWKFILLSLITFGIYGLVQMANIAHETNIVCSKYDYKNTMSAYVAYLLLGPITLGIYLLIWNHGLYSRIGKELQRRGLDYKFGSNTYWLYSVVCAFLIIPPFISINKLIDANRMLNQSYNSIG